MEDLSLEERHRQATEKIAQALALLSARFHEPDEATVDTPARVAKYWMELLDSPDEPETTEDLILDATNERFRLTTFGTQYDGLLVEKNLSFAGACEHHLLPIIGICHIGYIPDSRILGLSKLARVTKCMAKKPQTQERFTHELGEYFKKILNPRFLALHIEAEHTCMSARGVNESNARTITSFVYPATPEWASTKQEFQSLIK